MFSIFQRQRFQCWTQLLRVHAFKQQSLFNYVFILVREQFKTNLMIFEFLKLFRVLQSYEQKKSSKLVEFHIILTFSVMKIWEETGYGSIHFKKAPAHLLNFPVITDKNHLQNIFGILAKSKRASRGHTNVNMNC